MGANAESTVKVPVSHGDTEDEKPDWAEWKCTHCKTWTKGQSCPSCNIRG